jgi:hypothetical protein
MKAKISGDKIWKRLGDKQVLNKIVEIHNCENEHLYMRQPKFDGIERLFINSCDMKFIKQWVTLSTFPNVKDIYFMNPLFDFSICHRFGNSKFYIPMVRSIDKGTYGNIDMMSNVLIQNAFDEHVEESLIVCLDVPYHY